MTRYLAYSALLHAAAAGILVFFLTRVPPPAAYYGFQFLGGQSGFGTGKLEPAPAPLTREPGTGPAAEVPPAEPPPPAEDPQRIALEKEPQGKKAAEAPPEEAKPVKKGGAKGGRGDSAVGRGDFQGAKSGPVGGVGTSLEIGGFGPGGGGGASKPFPFKWYGELIYKRLWEAWDRSDAGTRECKVGFVVQRDGSVKSVKIKASSGDSLFDMTAKRAVTAAAPFPPLPDGFKEKELPVVVRFRLQ